MERRRNLRSLGIPGIVVLAFVVAASCRGAAAQSQDTENEIIANLAGGRVIVHVTKDDVIVFAAIDHPVETGSVPPRVAELDIMHIGVFLGSSECGSRVWPTRFWGD